MNKDIKENSTENNENDINKTENDIENSKNDINVTEIDAKNSKNDIADSESDIREEEKYNPYYVKFSKPLEHNGKTYEGLDMSKVRDLTTKEKIEIDRIYERIENVKPRNPMSSTMYAVCTAQYVTKLPMEFFYRMRSFEFMKIEAAIRIAFFMPI